MVTDRVERFGVQGVQGHHHIGGGRVAVVADPHPATGQLCFFLGDGSVRVEEQPRLGHQAGGVDPADPVWDRGQQPVGERDRLGSQVMGLPGDLTGAPQRHPTGAGVLPEPRQAVDQLQGVGQQVPGRVQADPQRGTEIGGRELPHQRRPHTGQRGDGLLEQAPLAPRRGQLVLRARVQPGPLHDQLDLRHRSSLLGLTRGTDTVDHHATTALDVRLGARGRFHASILRLRADIFDHVFENVDDFLDLGLGCLAVGVSRACPRLSARFARCSTTHLDRTHRPPLRRRPHAPPHRPPQPGTSARPVRAGAAVPSVSPARGRRRRARPRGPGQARGRDPASRSRFQDPPARAGADSGRCRRSRVPWIECDTDPRVRAELRAARRREPGPGWGRGEGAGSAWPGRRGRCRACRPRSPRWG